jgi:hypothetical protein
VLLCSRTQRERLGDLGQAASCVPPRRLDPGQLTRAPITRPTPNAADRQQRLTLHAADGIVPQIVERVDAAFDRFHGPSRRVDAVSPSAVRVLRRCRQSAGLSMRAARHGIG